MNGAAIPASGSAPPAAVTVIVPTYQRAHVLPRALRSVLGQTFKAFELLVVDDGSTDNTASVVEAFRDPRIRYLRQRENAGAAAARNRGIREARGELISFLDSDDEWLPEKLRSQVELLRRSPPTVGLVYTGARSLDGKGRLRELHVPTCRGDVRPAMLEANIIHGCSGVMIRACVVEVVGFFDEDIPAIEDYDYWLRVSESFHFDFLQEPLFLYHDDRDEDRLTTDGEKNLRARAYFYRKHESDLKEAGLAHEFLLESSRRALYWYRDRRQARSLALQSIAVRPRQTTAYRSFVRALPPPIHESLAAGYRFAKWTTRPIIQRVRR